MFTLDQRREVGAAARAFSLPEAHVLAVTEVESGGVIFANVNDEQRPLILFEPHIFYRRLKGTERDEAERLNLASERWNKKLYPASQAARWAQLERAAEINEQAAYESASYGVGQVMGFHWKALGYGSVADLVNRAKSGLGGQVELMLRFVATNNLTDELAAGQWAPFARGYNGAGYKANRYDEKMAAAAAKFGGAISEPNGLLRMGSKGRRVRELQALLVRAGYPVKEDGDFGKTTKAALVGFQTARGLKADGIYGPQTESALGELRQAADDRPGKQAVTKLVDVQKGVGGGLGAGMAIAGAKEVLQDASYQVASLGVSLRILDYVQTGLTIGIAVCAIVGLGYAAHGWWKSKQTVEA